MITPILFSYISNHQSTSLIITGLRKFYLPLMIAGIYALIRHLLGLPIIVGTQTDSVASSFNIGTFALHITKSFGEILGFSFGPAYLTGFQYADWVPFNALLLNIPFISVFFAFSILSIFSLYAYIIATLSLEKHINTLNIAMITLIFAASVTFRLELRWLLPAYLCFFMLIFRNFTLNSSEGDSSQFKRVKIFLCTALILSTISASFLYHLHARGLLYFASKLDNSTALIIHIKPYLFKQPSN